MHARSPLKYASRSTGEALPERQFLLTVNIPLSSKMCDRPSYVAGHFFKVTIAEWM